MPDKNKNKKKDINKKITNTIIDFVTPQSLPEAALMATGPVGVGTRTLLRSAVNSKVLRPTVEFLADLKLLKNRKADYQKALKNRNANQIKDSKYLTEKQNSLNAVNKEIDQLEKLTKNKSTFNFNKTNDYSVKKYNHGGPHMNIPVNPAMKNIPVAPPPGTITATDNSLSAKMKRTADKITNFSMAPGGGSHGAPTQMLAELTGIPSLLRLPNSYKQAKNDPSGENIINATANTLGVVPGAKVLSSAAKGLKGAGPLLSNANKVLNSSVIGGLGKFFKGKKLTETVKKGKYGGKRYYEDGGIPLPGGEMNPIPGSDAVEFEGASHEQGGIELDPQTEVEGGETMDQVTMRDGGKSDYFFSQHLKLGGKPFSARHKQILEMGGSQEQIDDLARVQEQVAGRDETQVAKMGGKKLYETGGVNSLIHMIAEQNKANKGTTNYVEANVPGYKQEKYLPTSPGYRSDGSLEGSSTYNQISNNEFVNEEEDVNKVLNIISSNLDKTEKELNEKKTENKENKEKKKEERKKEEPIPTIEKEEVDKVSEDTEISPDLSYTTNPKITEDGTYTDSEGNTYVLDNGKWTVKWKESDDFTDMQFDPSESGDLTAVEKKKDPSTEGDMGVDGYRRRGNVDALTVGAMFGQLLPAASAMMDNPDYMGTHQTTAGNISVAPELAKKQLQRVSMDADRARNAADYRSMSRFIENSGMGPAAIANRMAAWSRKQEGDRQISAQESKINAGIDNTEKQINAGIEKQNVANMMANSQFNARQQNAINMFNAGQTMKTDEFNRGADAATKDRRLMGLQNAMQTLAGINKDRLAYDAQDRMAQAISGNSGVLSREEIARDLAKAYPDSNINSESFQKMVEDTYLKTLKNSTNQNA